MKNKYLVVAVLISFFISLIPFVWVYIANDFTYPDMPVEFTDDGLFYYTRAMQVVEGNYEIGNAYLYEHTHEVAPAFFVADWFWALPLLVGFSLTASIILNQIFWFGICAALLFVLYRKSGISERYASMYTSATLVAVYWYMARPVSMQIVFPFFIASLLSIFFFLERPKSIFRIVVAGISTALAVYVYTYLAQIMFVIFGFVCVGSLFPRWKEYRTLWYSGLITLGASFPFIAYTWMQIHHPLYFETLFRIGLVETHGLGSRALLYVTLLVLVWVALLFLRKYVPVKYMQGMSLVTCGLFLTTISNVFTGHDLETAVHVGRFVELWTVFIFFVTAHYVWTRKIKQVKIICVLILLFFGGSIFEIHQIRTWRNLDTNLFRNDVYYESIRWLSENTPKNTIILANDSISSYVPLLRNNYVLFHPNAELYMLGDREIEDRYLSSRLFQNLSLKEIREDMRKYAGAGYTAHRHMTHNRNVKVCKFLMLDVFGRDCGVFTDQYELKGDVYFEDMETQYKRFKKDPLGALKKYDVAYVVVDTAEDDWELPTFFKEVWSDGRFVIYMVSSILYETTSF